LYKSYVSLASDKKQTLKRRNDWGDSDAKIIPMQGADKFSMQYSYAWPEEGPT